MSDSLITPNNISVQKIHEVKDLRRGEGLKKDSCIVGNVGSASQDVLDSAASITTIYIYIKKKYSQHVCRKHF